ncbi:MAG: hypothetical protein IT201_10635 [Thermoleophilia bacterium]|nr:hypothetical protein [Thermoleophilia bacterium]
MSGEPLGWPRRRFSQAISEGDGISVIPLVSDRLGPLAGEAAEAGAEALAVGLPGDVAAVRHVTALPLVLRAGVAGEEALQVARRAGADACVLSFGELSGGGSLLEDLAGVAQSLGLDWALAVSSEEELERALERLDPEIVVLCARPDDRDEEALERLLDLLPDVPAGKLVVAETETTTREQVLELERAGVDAVLVAAELAPAALAELTGRA